MREAERVTRGAGGRNGLRRAARTLGRRPGRVLPEPKGYADRIRSRAEQRDRTVDAPAHRDHGTAGSRDGPKDLSQCRCERLDRERLAGHRSRLQQCQPDERTVEAGRVCSSDAVSVDAETHGGPIAVPRRVADDLHPCHAVRLDADRRTRACFEGAPPCR